MCLMHNYGGRRVLQRWKALSTCRSRYARGYHVVDDALSGAVAPHQGFSFGSERTAIVPAEAQRQNYRRTCAQRDVDDGDVSARLQKNLSSRNSTDRLDLHLDGEIFVVVCPMHVQTALRCAFVKCRRPHPSPKCSSALSWALEPGAFGSCPSRSGAILSPCASRR